MRIFLFLSLFLQLSWTSAVWAQDEGEHQKRRNEFDEYYEKMRQYFAPLHWIPILIPRGEQVGNVYNLENLSFVADRKLCFPKVSLPQESPSGGLPSLIVENNANASLALGIRYVADAKGNLQNASRIEILFTEVKVSSLPALRLANALDVKKCKFLKAEIDAARNENKSAMGDIVIGELLIAKKTVRITYNDQAGLSTSVSQLQNLIRIAGLAASAKAERGKTNIVTVEYGSPLPIAMRPAFLPSMPYWGYSRTSSAPFWTMLNLNDNWQQKKINALADSLTSAQFFVFSRDKYE